MSLLFTRIIKSERYWFILLLALHVLGIFGLFGFANLSNPRPVIERDYGLHFYRAALLRDSNGFPGLIWDPYYMGGYKLGGAMDVDNRLGELGVTLLKFLPVGTAWNWTLIILYSSVPILLYLAGRWSGSNTLTSVIASALGTILFWSIYRGDYDYISAGMYSWIILCASLPLLFTALQQAINRPGLKSAILLGISVSFVAYAHGLSFIYLPFMAILFLFRLKQIKKTTFLALGGAILITLVLIWPILRPLMNSLSESIGNAANLALYYQSNFSEIVRLFTTPYRIFSNTLLIFCLVGIITKMLNREQKELAIISLMIVFVFLFCFLPFPISWLQPLRNLEAALFLAVIPSSQLILHIFNKPLHLKSLGTLAKIGLILAISIPSLSTWGISIIGKSTLKIEKSQTSKTLIRYLQTHTQDNARILIEDCSWHFGGHHLGDKDILGYLAREVNRELIGGPHPVTLSNMSFANFVNGRLFGRSINEFDDDALNLFLETYNIGAIVVWSEASKDRFLRLGLVANEIADNIAFFRTDIASSFAVGAKNVVARAKPNMIRVKGAISSPTILKWHFDSRLVSDPPLPIQSAPNPFGPAGFICIQNGNVSEFTIYYEDKIIFFRNAKSQ